MSDGYVLYLLLFVPDIGKGGGGEGGGEREGGRQTETERQRHTERGKNVQAVISNTDQS